MHEYKYNGMSIFFNTAAELDKFKANLPKDDAITVEQLRAALDEAKAKIAEKQGEIDALVEANPEDVEAKIEEIRAEMEAEFTEKAALLAEAVAETGEKMDSLSKLTKRQLLEKLTGIKDDSMSDAELQGYRKGQVASRKKNTRNADSGARKERKLHEQYGVKI